MEWPIPRNINEIESFMGLVGYYMRSIKKISKIGNPITPLKRKGKKIECIAKCTSSFEKLKQLFTNSPVLMVADRDMYFLVCTNAYKKGLCGVLMHEGQVVYYESMKLNEHEVNYVTHDLEIDSIIRALNMWRHYLLGKKFTLVIDHSGLKYLFKQTKLNTRKAICLTIHSELEFEIKYIKGKEKRVVYALSWRIQVNHLAATISYEIDLVERVNNVGQHD